VSAQGGQKPLYVIPLGRALLAHAIAEAPPARRQAADDPRRSEGSGFYERNSAVRIGEPPSDAVPRRPATAPRSQARSHDITVTSGLTGAPDPRVKRSSVTFRASEPSFLGAGTESSNPPPSSGESATLGPPQDEKSSMMSTLGEFAEVRPELGAAVANGRRGAP